MTVLLEAVYVLEALLAYAEVPVFVAGLVVIALVVAHEGLGACHVSLFTE